MSKVDPNEVRKFVLTNSFGILSTLSVACPGFPFGSVVPYDCYESGSLVIYISRLAQHHKNISVDPRSSLCIIDPAGVSDPQAHARATLMLSWELVGDDRRSAVAESYYKKFPKAKAYQQTHDFEFFIATPSRVRWIGGFGDIAWIEAEAFSSVS